MQPDEILELQWTKLDEAILEAARDFSVLADAVADRNGDKAGKYVTLIIKQSIEMYTRLGVVAVLEGIEYA